MKKSQLSCAEKDHRPPIRKILIPDNDFAFLAFTPPLFTEQQDGHFLKQ